MTISICNSDSRWSDWLRSLSIGLALIGALVSATGANAQTAEVAEVEIDRDSAALRDEIRPRPEDQDFVDTVLVFTNTQAQRQVVLCIARNRDGSVVGRTRTYLPPSGLKYILASDLSNGRDFVGHASCASGGHVLPSAVLVGRQIENLNVHGNGVTKRMFFPLVATY